MAGAHKISTVPACSALVFFALILVASVWTSGPHTTTPVAKPLTCGKRPNELTGVHEAVLVDRLAIAYQKYGAQWLKRREAAIAFCSQGFKRPRCLSDDLEMEVTYFRLRAFRPKLVWEISPADGFSTTIILSALADNGDDGKLVSFDVRDDAQRYVPTELHEGRWQLRVGNVKEVDFSIESPPDYLFLDSYHSYDMALFYTRQLLPMFNTKHLPVSLHDAYNPGFWADGIRGRNLSIYPAWMPNAEAIAVIDWLKDQPYFCGSFSVSIHHLPKATYDSFVGMRAQVLGDHHSLQGVHGKFDATAPNPTLFFELNCPLASWCKA